MDTVTNQSVGGLTPPPSPQVVAVATNAADQTTNAANQTTTVSRRQRFNTAGVVCAVAGAAILIMGLVSLARADLDGSFNEPIFQVAGWDHTQTLAFVEVMLGIMLLVAGMTRGMLRVINGPFMCRDMVCGWWPLRTARAHNPCGYDAAILASHR